MTRPRKELRIEDLTAIQDSREQTPLDLAPLKIQRGTLSTGDYSILGLEHCIAIERKSLPDLIMCVGVERDRFDRECQRLLAYETRAIIVEGTWGQLEAGGWRSQVTPAAALGSVLGWIAMSLPILFVGDHAAAGRYVSRLLFIAARRRWRELQAMCDGLKIAPQDPLTIASPDGICTIPVSK